MVDDVIAGMREFIDGDRRFDGRDRIGREIATVEAQVSNLTDAIALGGDMPALVQRLQKADTRRQELARQQLALGDGPIVPRIDWRLWSARRAAF